MIERRYGNIVFVCDECEMEEFETEESNLHDALDVLRTEKDNQGRAWQSFNDDGEWKHICPGCQLEVTY